MATSLVSFGDKNLFMERRPIEVKTAASRQGNRHESGKQVSDER